MPSLAEGKLTAEGLGRLGEDAVAWVLGALSAPGQLPTALPVLSFGVGSVMTPRLSGLHLWKGANQNVI